MTAIIHRSALVFHGHDVPPDLAYVVSDWRGRRVVTWAEVMEERRERQRWMLARKRHVEQWRAVKLWVAYFDQRLYGGWHAFIEDWRGERGQHWIRRADDSFASQVVKLFPLLLPMGEDHEDYWKAWQAAFAKRYQRRVQDRRPVGVAYLWRRGRQLSLRPEVRHA